MKYSYTFKTYKVKGNIIAKAYTLYNSAKGHYTLNYNYFAYLQKEVVLKVAYNNKLYYFKCFKGSKLVKATYTSIGLVLNVKGFIVISNSKRKKALG